MKARRLIVVVTGLIVACGDDGAGPAASTVRDSLGLKIATTDACFVEAADAFASVVDTLARVGSPDDRPGSEKLFEVAAASFLEGGRFVVLQPSLDQRQGRPPTVSDFTTALGHDRGRARRHRISASTS